MTDTSSGLPREQTIAERFAQFAHDVRYEDIPDRVLRDLEWHILDSLGVCLAATRLAYSRNLTAVLLADGGAGEATLFGSGRRVPARDAALHNGTLGHGIDWDDTHLEALLHPTATILPAVLAIAEQRGQDGKALLTALAIGAEAMIRIGLAGGLGLVGRGLHPTSMCGSFGVALAVSKLLGLSVEQTVSALGAAGGMTGGLHESVIDGSDNKCIHSALAVQAGVMAAELASVGFTGPSTIFEGQKGFFRAFADATELDVVTRDLGADWHAGRLAYKAYACCQGAHPAADCALMIVRDHGVDHRDIAGIKVWVGSRVGWTLCEPAEIKKRPPTAYGAKFSVPFVIATALVDGFVTLESFSEENIADPVRHALADKVSHVADPYYDVGMARRGRIVVRLRDGREIDVSTDACTGTPENPWKPEGIIGKFMALAAPVIGVEQAARLAEIAPRTGQMTALTPLVQLLGPAETNVQESEACI